MPEIGYVSIFTNGMVAVFDKQGEQIPELQGRFANVSEQISKQLHKQSELAEIKFSQWKGATIEVYDLESFDRLWKKEDLQSKVYI